MTGTVTFVPTLEDHIVAQRLWLMSYLRRPVTMILLVLMVLLVLGGSAIALKAILRDESSVAAAFGDQAVPIGAPLLFMTLQVVAWWRIPGSVARMSKQQPSLLSETTWEWNNDTVIATSQAGSSRVPLTEVFRWLDGRESIVLMPQERLLLILPQRFLTEHRAADLRDALERFAGGRRWPRAIR